MPDLARLTATEAARLIRAGTLRPEALMDACLARRVPRPFQIPSAHRGQRLGRRINDIGQCAAGKNVDPYGWGSLPGLHRMFHRCHNGAPARRAPVHARAAG